jgi:hypothetical protein
MGVRERVQEAMNASTARAEKILAEAAHADQHERLTILINGWFQGIASALEEIALELDTRASTKDEPARGPTSTTPERSASAAPEEAEPRQAERSQGEDEAALLERARESSKATQALQAERDAAPEDSDDS